MLTHGLSFQASYTWSHSIDDTSGYETSSAIGYRTLNPYNFGLYRGDSTFDARQRLVVNYDYEILHLSRYWNNTFTRLLDGWHIAGITTLQTGFPILIADTGYRSLTCDTYAYYGCWDAPNLVSSVNTVNPRTSSFVNQTKNSTATTSRPYYWFNPNDFALAPIGSMGNTGRNNFHGPGINNTDLVLSKRVYLGHESRFLELRLEGYNVFNHTQFQYVATTIGGSGVNGDINSSNFGRVTSAIAGRTIQLGAKIYF